MLLFPFSAHSWVFHPNTRIYVTLLGPCFKTGQLKPSYAKVSESRNNAGTITSNHNPARQDHNSMQQSNTKPYDSFSLQKRLRYDKQSQFLLPAQAITHQQADATFLHLRAKPKLSLADFYSSLLPQQTNGTHTGLWGLQCMHYCLLQKRMNRSNDNYNCLSFWQLQGLFNSLFKVLFIFPSRYLFAIGLLPMFSFRWNLPPT